MTRDLQEHYRSIKLTLLLVLALNWLVALAKILYGRYILCESMAADGFHSLSDGASNIIGVIGVFFASRPKDTDHPYGHKKYETFFSLGISALLFILSFSLAKEGLLHLFKPAIPPRIDFRSFVLMLFTMAVNFWVMNYEHQKGEDLKSDILTSDAMHTKADLLTSLSVIIALTAVKLGYPVIDPIATIVISLFIAHAGYDILKSSSAVLCDTAVIDEKRIVDVVLRVKGVKACHKIRTRGRPDDIHVDLHVQIDPDTHIDKAHRISYAIEETIKKEIPEATDVVVHMEPKERA